MKKRIITLMLCFVLVFAMAGAVEAKITLSGNKCDLNVIDAEISNVLSHVNSNTQYTEFIANSNYSAVKLIIDKKNASYFIYNKDTKQVEQADSTIKENFTVKVTCKQMMKIIKDYNSDSLKLNRAILNRIPMKVKSNILKQCFDTGWCINKLLGK
jgi:hypothetical protein